ncbi:UNVERIFIED_CONTAM: protein ECERIFERUM 2 [Sesamum radiatum]|uniref:Protein ECERIFERUM 2 n=1 Tax=Sesamum radiatum TaxID=300843 RepID=A0AAW2MG52_SESRA
MAEVLFICKRTVSSSKPVQPGQISPLSILDRVMEHNHLRVVFYYSLQTRRRAGELTKKLRESITDMLSAFPVVTGRLLRTSEGDWTIKCNDAGVRMVEARVEGTVDEWLKNVDREKELKLVHWEEMFQRQYFWSTFYVQITEFEGGGLAVGLSCTHLLSDPTCAAMMIKSWADVTLNGEIIAPPFFHPLPPPRTGKKNRNFHSINHYKSAKENSVPASDTKQTTIMLKFNQEMVKSCIAMARTTNAHNCQPSLTPFEALAALFWTRLSKVKGMKSGLVDMSLCLDVRKVLGLEKGFFGNCMVYNRVQGDGIQENDLSKAAGFIREAVSKIDRDEVMDLIEWLEQENWITYPSCMNGSCLICANLENVNSYSAVFEENSSPLRVSYYIEPSVGAGQILILPSPGGDGPCSRVVSVTLPEVEAEKLLEDGLIKQFGPTIWMGLNRNLC